MPAPKRLSILLAVDGSSHAQAAAQLVRDLPLAPGSTVTALGVLTLRNYVYTPGRASLLQALDQAEAALQGSAAEVRTGLRQGHPAEELIRYAHEHSPDLVVVGAQGLRATLGILLGGVAQQVVEYAHWPVLIVRAPYTALRRVLLATDGSPYSQRALDYLARFPLPAGAEVRAMHVLPPEMEAAPPSPVTDAAAPAPFDAAEQNEAEERAGKANLAQVKHELHAAGYAAAGVLIRGDAATEILQYARAQGIDLLVVGSRGLSNVRGWLLGSLSRKLVHYAPCSVLVVRADTDQSD